MQRTHSPGICLPVELTSGKGLESLSPVGDLQLVWRRVNTEADGLEWLRAAGLSIYWMGRFLDEGGTREQQARSRFNRGWKKREGGVGRWQNLKKIERV